MQVYENFLTPNEYSRPQKRIKELKAIVLHWTGTPSQNAHETRAYFESLKTRKDTYASAHYIIDQQGIILSIIPENEISYHCGSSLPDPLSGKIYTDIARKKFGCYATERSSPNFCTIGIELCPNDIAGNFTTETVKAAAELCADICKRYGLNLMDIMTHKDVVGWKNCPRLWVEKPALFTAFLATVADKIYRG